MRKVVPPPFRKTITCAGLALLIAIVAGVAFFFGNHHGQATMTITRVAPDQLARAMEGDYFYSSYSGNTLVIRGIVNSVQRSGTGLVVRFRTKSSFGAKCDFRNDQPVVKSGESIMALSEGASAQREPSAVLLENCALP